MKQRLDQIVVKKGLVETRSQAENFIRLGEVSVNGRIIKKAGYFVGDNDEIKLLALERYVSRAALKLASVAQSFKLDFKNKVILDVGSSTGGFTDYALQRGAKKSIAVEVGTNQLHSSLHNDERIELHEQTDIRNMKSLSAMPDIVVIDVSFISLRDILPHISSLVGTSTQIVAMLKPQFEAGSGAKHKGVIKNDRMRRDILSDFELWARQRFVIKAKADSQIAGAKGNVERFYLMQTSKPSKT